MMTRYKHTTSGCEINSGHRQYIAAISLGLAGNETEAELVSLGFERLPDPPPPAKAPRRISKLKLRRAFIEKGKHSTFRTWIKSDPDLEDQYNDSQYLDEGDTVFCGALQNVRTVLGLSEAEADALLDACQL